jgi:hypothetical protein
LRPVSIVHLLLGLLVEVLVEPVLDLLLPGQIAILCELADVNELALMNDVSP